jgi:hypothetical protein
MLMFIQMESFCTDNDELLAYGTTGTFQISRMHTALEAINFKGVVVRTKVPGRSNTQRQSQTNGHKPRHEAALVM